MGFTQIGRASTEPGDALPDRSRDRLGLVAGKVAHEVNNLMTIVISNLELASLRALDENQRKHLHRATWAANLAAHLTRQALMVVRDEDGESPVTDINAAIAGMDSLPYQLEGREVTLVQHLAPDALLVRLDPDQLELSLINLLRNAADAMPHGGKVTVATALAPTPAWVEVSLADTGRGIPNDIIDRVSQPLFTTKPPGQGTGLGLALVRTFVERAEGVLKIDSRCGLGTTIRMRFPRAEIGFDRRISARG
jgi:signal transduction histidine kinase